VSKLSKRDRAQLVELLRCAADLLLNHQDPFPVMTAYRALGTPPGVYNASVDVRSTLLGWPQDEGHLLEAALRVEEKEWP
jgi:hypothetical protein